MGLRIPENLEWKSGDTGKRQLVNSVFKQRPSKFEIHILFFFLSGDTIPSPWDVTEFFFKMEHIWAGQEVPRRAWTCFMIGNECLYNCILSCSCYQFWDLEKCTESFLLPGQKSASPFSTIHVSDHAIIFVLSKYVLSQPLSNESCCRG